MPYRPLDTQRKVFSANGSSDIFYWTGGYGSFAVQGDQGGGTLVVECYLRSSAEGGDPGTGTFATVTDGLTADAVSIDGLSGESGMKGIAFNAPACFLRMTLSGATSPACVGVIGRDQIRTR